jgi:putative hydrolase of the HAD superfamily
MTPGYTFRVYMEQIGILDYFDVLTFSDEVRLAKPSRAIFLQTANEMGVPPEQIAHVGDHLLNDVLGARNADMKTVWIETYDERRKAVEVKPDVTVPALADVAEAIYSLG